LPTRRTTTEPGAKAAGVAVFDAYGVTEGVGVAAAGSTGAKDTALYTLALLPYTMGWNVLFVG